MTDFPTSNSRGRKKRRPKVAWLAIGCVVVGVWSLGFAIWLDARSTGTATLAMDLLRAVAQGFGGALAGAAVTGVLLWLADGRDARKALARFGVLAMVALVASVPLTGLKAMVSGYANEDKATEEAMARIGERRDAFLDQVDEDRDAIMEGGFMEASALSRPGGVERARRKVAELRELSRRAQAEDERLALAARAELEALPASPTRRADMLKGFDQSFAASKAEADEELALGMRLFDEVDAQLDILSRRPRAWGPYRGSIGFDRDSDMNAFNAHSARIRDISALLDAMQARRAARQADAARKAGFDT